MSPAEIFSFAGGLVPTLLISRLFLWITKSWDGGVPRLLSVHFVSWLLMSFIGGIGLADGGAFAGIDAAKDYALPQTFWLLFDMWRLRRG